MCVCALQMDGDSSTTDASQLGITGEYMASGHYVLQSQDGEERPKSRSDNQRSALCLGSGHKELTPCVLCVLQMTERRV